MQYPLVTAAAAKRSPRAVGLDRWYPYYAGFSSGFARQCLEAFGRPGGTVLDPWNGSGTTTAACASAGIHSIGIDLSPVARLIAEAKTVRLPNRDYAEQLWRTYAASRVAAPSRLIEADPLREWLHPDVLTEFRRLMSAADSGVAEGCLKSDEGALLRLCLLRATRRFAVEDRSSNPTWQRPRKLLEAGSLIDAARALFFSCVNDVLGPPLEAIPVLLCGDARSTGLPDGSIDLVLTSPPYCTRIDYAAKTRFELLACQEQPTEFMELRVAMMGTTAIRMKERPKVKDGWPESVKRLLLAVGTHPSHGSVSYYYKNLWQYFDDAEVAVREIARVLRPGGRALLVLQTSYYKEISIDLPALYLDLGSSSGLFGCTVSGSEVTRVKSRIHSKSKRYRESNAYREDVILLERSK